MPRLLDLFCCEGAGARGYAAAGWEVVGVDLRSSVLRHYPYESHRADALEFVKEYGHEFDAVHASPPCQAYSVTRHSHGVEHPELIGPTRDALVATGLPYVIENVSGARRHLRAPVTLCGSEFGLSAVDDDGTRLRMERHRLFETNWLLMGAGGCWHDPAVPVGGAYGGASSDRVRARTVRKGGYVPSKRVQAELLGLPLSMTLHGLAQSIPPAYTEHIGSQLLGVVSAG